MIRVRVPDHVPLAQMVASARALKRNPAMGWGITIGPVTVGSGGVSVQPSVGVGLDAGKAGSAGAGVGLSGDGVSGGIGAEVFGVGGSAGGGVGTQGVGVGGGVKGGGKKAGVGGGLEWDGESFGAGVKAQAGGYGASGGLGTDGFSGDTWSPYKPGSDRGSEPAGVSPIDLEMGRERPEAPSVLVMLPPPGGSTSRGVVAAVALGGAVASVGIVWFLSKRKKTA